MVKITFLGAAGTVTGSKFLISFSSRHILIDCGLFQGIKEHRELNWKKLPVDPVSIEKVILTHGHLDHCGYLPRLKASGFKGKVLGTAPTLEIAGIILRDSAKIQEEEAYVANKRGYSKHHPAKPLYTLQDAEDVIKSFEPVKISEWIKFDQFQMRLNCSGHILGATFVELKISNKVFVFSGDIGREKDYLMFPPEKPRQADVVVMESTYGDRNHLPENPQLVIQNAIRRVIEENGTLLIPCFAVERLQTLIFLLFEMHKNDSIANLPVYVDSPMGAGVTEVYEKYVNWHKLSAEKLHEISRFVKVVSSFKHTLALREDNRPKIILAGSGMLTGGRILDYLEKFLEKPATTILLTGYQAPGTRGRLLADGADDIKIRGKYYQANAKVLYLNSLSAHAGQKELLNWLNQIAPAPEKVFLVHGEPQALDALRLKINDAYGWQVFIPKLGETFEISL